MKKYIYIVVLMCIGMQAYAQTYEELVGKAMDAVEADSLYDAEKFFKHMSIRLSLDKYIQGNELDESLKEFEEDLKVIATRHHKTIQQLISNFLVNKKEKK
mgnify:CR=1 FL=1